MFGEQFFVRGRQIIFSPSRLCIDGNCNVSRIILNTPYHHLSLTTIAVRGYSKMSGSPPLVGVRFGSRSCASAPVDASLGVHATSSASSSVSTSASGSSMGRIWFLLISMIKSPNKHRTSKPGSLNSHTRPVSGLISIWPGYCPAHDIARRVLLAVPQHPVHALQAIRIFEPGRLHNFSARSFPRVITSM